MGNYDALVVGSGPNGLAAAITLQEAGRKTLLIEARDTLGGGMRTKELTLPGFKHDVCSAIHPSWNSPFFRRLPLADYGLKWIHPEATIAHPLEEGAALAYKSLEKTAEGLGADADAYRFLYGPLVASWGKLEEDVLHPLLGVPKHLVPLARFGWRALLPATILGKTFFKTEAARALFGGVAAHGILPLGNIGTAAAGMLLGTIGHVAGWPLPKGGSQALADALAAHFVSLGGEVQTGLEVAHLDELPDAEIVMLDITPKQFLAMTDKLPAAYRRALESFKYGAGAFKLDYALSEPVPWKDERVAQAATVHLGGTLSELAASEEGLTRGQAPQKPYVLVAQQSLFDDSRAPAGKHTLWAYCHVPNGFKGDMTGAIETQIERFAPGFKDTVLARHIMSAPDLQSYNPNYIGGDINGGAATLWQLAARPVLRPNPYQTPLKGVYLCSASTPPGGGVHGMGGYNAARSAVKALSSAGAGRSKQVRACPAPRTGSNPK